MRELTRVSTGLLLAALLLASAPSPHAQAPAPALATTVQGQQAPPQRQPPSAAPQGQQGQNPQGQNAQGQVQQPTFRTGVNFVRVDAIVTDKDGNAVKDLKPEDFEVTEDGKPQKVETFKFLSVSGEAAPDEPAPKRIVSEYDEESEAARDDVRLFAILLDDYHVSRGASMVVQQPLVSFIQKQLGPADMLGLMFPLTPVSAVRMSRDRDEAVRVIEHFQGRKYDYQPRNDIEEKYSMYPASVVEQIRNQVTLSALRSLVVHMGSLREGRKAVILVSEGFSNVLPPSMQDPIASMPGLGNPNRGSQAGVDDRTQFFANMDMLQDLKEIYSAANRSNTTIYTLDPRGLATFEFDMDKNVGLEGDRKMLESTQDTLRVLADQTDGRAIVNRNDLEGGLKQVVKDSSAYYLLGYSSTRPNNDGKFHEIKVRLRRPGLQVRARKGYWALTAEEMARSTEAASAKSAVSPEVNKALTSVDTRRDRYIRSWVGTSRGENGKTRVTFVWEPVPVVPGLEKTKATKVSIIASGSGDRPYYRGAVGDAAGASQAAATGATGTAAAPSPGAARSVTFDADPGTLQLRMSVEGGGEVLDTDVREYKVPDMTRPMVGLSTPAVYRAANAREFQAIVGQGDSAVPTASREFRRTERLLVRFEAYAPGNESPVVTARVLNRAGKPMADLPLKAPDAPGRPFSVDVPLAGFPSGEYLIELKVKGQEGEAQELIGMKVSG